MQQVDIIVIGAGMAGASLGYEVSAEAKVLLLERETQPGYHSTGRSAAAFIPSYGHKNIVLHRLTKASRAFLEEPKLDFCEGPLLVKRGLLTVGTDVAKIQAEFESLRTSVDGLELICGDAALATLPALRSEYTRCALFEPSVFDIDVDRLHQSYLRGLRSRGGQLHCAVEVRSISRQAGQYLVATNVGEFCAPTLVNAAGAWADEVAIKAGVKPIGLQPLRRTAVLMDPPLAASVEDWPLVLAQDESFYAKPDAGALLVSPADEHPSPPLDAFPEELDIALAVHHAQQALQIDQPRVRASWAGLRCFVPDRTPVVGFDEEQASFFWLCGQGGHGIQTAPAMARLAAALLFGKSVAQSLGGYHFPTALVAPGRLRD